MKNTENRDIVLANLQEKIDYKFKNRELLSIALTHSSYVNENRMNKLGHNERLEFLGDSVLNLVVSECLYRRHPKYPEGKLTKLRASIVCEASLAFIARKLNLGEYLSLGKGEEASGGRCRNSILADALEALIGAIYLDGGLKSSQNFIIDVFEKELLGDIDIRCLFTDYKTELQETLQKIKKSQVEYLVSKEEGPDHEKTFHIDLIIDGDIYGKGVGRNRKEAEQMAAKSALDRIGVNNE